MENCRVGATYASYLLTDGRKKAQECAKKLSNKTDKYVVATHVRESYGSLRITRLHYEVVKAKAAPTVNKTKVTPIVPYILKGLATLLMMPLISNGANPYGANYTGSKQ